LIRDSDEEPEESTQFIDTLADVQQEPSEVPVLAGVSKLKLVRTIGKFSFPVELTVQTSTQFHRGVHMSRLVKAASGHRAASMEKWLRWLCDEVNRTQPGSEVTSRYEMPYRDQFARVAIQATSMGAMTYRFDVQGMTACPCSKKMIGIGHMQRAEISLVLRNRRELDVPRTLDRVWESFSAVPVEMMKRVDEAKKILEAQDNPKFAEDLVRECAKRFPNALYISSRCFESIHAHDAVATWSRRPGWVPAL
jgi:GTP cyclohydrolase FolE2